MRARVRDQKNVKMRNEWLMLFLLLAGGVGGMRLTEVEVPPVALEGDDIHLRCHYEGAPSLYSLKWYKDGREIYRHQPGFASPSAPTRYLTPGAPHEESGVTIDSWGSSERDVVLVNVTVATTGEYKCEVIGDHPTFRKEDRQANLTVYGEPLQKPHIEGGKDSYSSEDLVSLNCSSSNTEYHPTLSWLLNGRPANESVVRGVDARTSELVFPATSDLFLRGVLRVGCRAFLSPQHSATGTLHLYSTHYLTAQEYYYNAGEEKTVCVLAMVAVLSLSATL